MVKYFDEKNAFLMNLLDCAYGYHHLFEEQGKRHESVQIRSTLRGICSKTVLIILKNHPLFLRLYCEDYPLV